MCISSSAKEIQRSWRGYRARQQLNRYYHEYDAAVKIQAAARGKLCRLPISTALAELAAKSVQRHWRGWQGRSKVAQFLLRSEWEEAAAREEAAAITIQEYWLEHLLRRRYIFEAKHAEDKAATALQAAVRGWRLRHHQWQFIHEDDAAVAIQTTWRHRQGSIAARSAQPCQPPAAPAIEAEARPAVGNVARLGRPPYTGHALSTAVPPASVRAPFSNADGDGMISPFALPSARAEGKAEGSRPRYFPTRSDGIWMQMERLRHERLR
eukprot:COSAG01_NODE_3257_length_6345_cov_4.979987_3_plen_267_part_00